MLPFDRVYKELARQEVGVIYAFHDARLPDGTYQFREYFCSAVCCTCRRVSLRVRELDSGRPVASLIFSLGAPGKLATSQISVTLDASQPQGELAEKLGSLFGQMIEWDPGYAEQLARHYELWREVVEDPFHPYYDRLRAALREEPVGNGTPACCCVQ